MNKRLLSLSLSFFLLACQSPQSTPDLLNGRILFLGDSITQDGRYVSIIEYELFKHYPQADIDLISVGLSSETVSGLTEPNHPYPRPNAHDRLGRVLAALQPQTVFACYGMNDGIYHPQSEERLQAYKDGILKLVADVKATGAQVILLTPPIFDATVISEKTVASNAEQFGYATPYEGYNDVLADYADWLKSLEESVTVIDLNGPMLVYTREQRQTNPDFALSDDGVHPQLAGHVLMAQTVLGSIGVPIDDIDPQHYAAQLEEDELYQLVHQRRAMRSMAWLVDIGFEMPWEYNALPVAETEEKAKAQKQEIVEMAKN